MNKEITAIRALSVEMIEKANSGHPGITLGAAPMMYALYAKIMNINPQNDKWSRRDRFVLSAGHGSAMLYASLHLAGFDLTINDLKNFRQTGSKTPGHPEYNHTVGVDSTSGPLGQGIAQAVGMAVAETHLAAKYNKPGMEIYNNYTYVICGDGDLQEGVSGEASSFAGHTNLGKLIVLWDANEVQLDDRTNMAISEDVLKRYESYKWQTLEVKDGNDLDEILNAIETAKKETSKPTIIKVNTIIGYGSPNKADSSASHGAPLGREEADATLKFLGWDYAPFEVPEDIYESFKNDINSRLEKQLAIESEIIEKYKKEYPKLYEEITNPNNNIELEYLETANEASRVSSGKILNEINKQIPNLIGGSADLSKSNNTTLTDSKIYSIDGYENQNISFGVREFSMGAIVNGIMLYGGLKAYGATFFVFSDYLKPAIRMSAIQEVPSIYIFTHDSIAVGEDGATHEPIEQLSGLRAIPNLNVIRPADYNETAQAYKWAIRSTQTPTALILTRQNLEVITPKDINDQFSKGAYVIYGDEDPDKILIATGSEVKLAIDSAKLLQQKGIKVRVISMPSMYMFEKQDEAYKKSLFNGLCKKHRYYIEMARAFEGYKYASNVIGINTFGLSGKPNELIKHFGFTPENISNIVLENE